MTARSTALHTDRYELTMLDAALRDGTAAPPLRLRAVRPAPVRRAAASASSPAPGACSALIDDFRFGDDELRFLRDERVVDAATLDFLEGYRFTGSITGYREGELYFPGSPILTIEGTFAEAVVLETLALSVLNHDSAVATAAARMSIAAGDRPLAEMGSRRAGEQSAVAAARAAYIAGFGATSNLEAGRRWGIPTMGTAAHAWTLLHDTEEDAFRSQVDALGVEHDAARRHLRHPRRASRRPSASPAPGSAACASTPATCRPWPPRCARSSTSSARPARRSP